MTARTDAPTWGTFAPIYEQILAHCPPLSFPPPWDFLPAPTHCRGPVTNPTAVLAELRARYDEATLHAAEVVCTTADGLRLAPLFAGPDAALIALRERPEGPLLALLTARGCLPRNLLSINAVQQDHWTREALRVHGVLYATPAIHEVVLLQALGLAATLSLGLERLTVSGLAQLHDSFQRDPPACGAMARPTLALVGGSLLALSAQPSPALAPVVQRLTGARKYLGIALPGVRSWSLGGDLLENLRFRVKLRHVRAVQKLLVDSTDNLDDLATLLPPGDVAAVAAAKAAADRRAFAAAQADLLAKLAETSTLGLSEGVQQARDLYEKQVESQLIAPLRDWALASSDPVLRNVGLQLTCACHQLHRLSPLLLSQQARQFERDRSATSEPLPQAFIQYLALARQVSQLIRDLCQWRKT